MTHFTAIKCLRFVSAVSGLVIFSVATFDHRADGQESTGTNPPQNVELPSSVVPEFDPYNPPTPPVNFSALSSGFGGGGQCDPLVFAPNMFGTITRAPQVCFRSTLITSTFRTETYRLFGDNDGSIGEAIYVGDGGDTTLSAVVGDPLTLGSPAGPVIATPAGSTILSTPNELR